MVANSQSKAPAGTCSHHERVLDVAVIVLNWNRKEDSLRCLASLLDQDYPSYTVLFVDNDSSDGSVEAVSQDFPQVEVIVNSANLGFAEGNNVGIHAALQQGFDAIMLLNNDTVVPSDLLSMLTSVMNADDAIGAVGPAIVYLHNPEIVWSSGGTIDWKRGVVTASHVDCSIDQLPREPFPVDHMSGCCMLVRADAIRRAGTLDSRFFMYYEETEWCVRLARAGYRLGIDPAARVLHDVTPDTHLRSSNIAYFMTRNHLLFLSVTGTPLPVRLRVMYRQLRTVLALFVKPTSLDRMRGRVPMLQAMRDYAIGSYGPRQPARRRADR